MKMQWTSSSTAPGNVAICLNAGYDYAVCKVSEGFLFTSGDEMVIVRGNDLDELKEIAATAKFK